MFGARTDLSTRSDQLQLPGNDDHRRFRDLLFAESGDDTWRLVELFSLAGEPFEAELSWSAGQGVGARALVTVSHSTRVSVYARSLRVRARNLAVDGNRVGVTVADGHTPTRNQWEHQGELEAGEPVIVVVPPFAARVRLDVAVPKALPQTRLSFVDGTGATRATVPGDAQPDRGVPIGGAREVHVHTRSPTPFRLLFDLSL